MQQLFQQLHRVARSSLRLLRRKSKLVNKLTLLALERRAYKSLQKSSQLPTTFNQKIRYKAAFDRRTVLTTFADKIGVRNYVTAKIGSEYLTKCYFSGSKLHAIPWADLPEEFVIKANHGSACNLIVWKGADPQDDLTKSPNQQPWVTHIVRPGRFSKTWAESRCRFWLEQNYSWREGTSRIPEWAYRNIKPAILIEELLQLENGNLPKDYKFHVFNGRVKFVNVIERKKRNPDTGEVNSTSALMNAKWVRQNLILNGLQPAKEMPAKPSNFEVMIDLAEKLAAGIDYVRVDLYNIDGRIVFGEMTNYPNAAKNTFVPESADLSWGQLLILDDYTKKRKASNRP